MPVSSLCAWPEGMLGGETGPSPGLRMAAAWGRDRTGSPGFRLRELAFTGGGWTSEARVQDGNSQANGPPVPTPCTSPSMSRPSPDGRLCGGLLWRSLPRVVLGDSLI